MDVRNALWASGGGWWTQCLLSVLHLGSHTSIQTSIRSHGRAPQPQSHLPSLCKATLIFPQGPRDDASWLQAFCRLHTASVERIRRFQESNYQLTHPELGQTARVHSRAEGEAVYKCVAVSMKGACSVPFGGTDGGRSLSTLNTMTQSRNNVHQKNSDTATAPI